MKTDSLKEPLMKTKQTKSHAEIKKTFKYQALMFILCYLTWVGVHTQRAYWSMSKSVMADQNPTLSMSFFAKIDTALFQTYSFSQFFTGAIGDAYEKRKVLAISLTIQALLFGLVGMVGGKH